MHALENAHTALLLLERSTGRVLEVNAAFPRLAGRRSDEIVGQNFWEPPLIADAAAGAEIHEHLRAGGAVQGAELPFVSADERWLLLEVSGTPAGDLIRLEVQDATAREQSRLAGRMEALRSLARRTAGEFQDLHRTLLSVNARDDLSQAAETAGNIASQLLAFSGDLKLQPRQISLNDLIETMLPNLRQMFGRDIELVCDLGPDLEPVWVDPAQVSRIVLHLATNSLEAMNRAGTFRIETRNSKAVELGINGTGGGSYAMLEISDTGPGLDDLSWAHLFEPFSSTKPNPQGRGLGLAAVYGIVRQSGGRLWAYSQPGKGATFRAYLPQSREHFPALPSAPSRTTQCDTTILLVEANDGLRSVLTNLLKAARLPGIGRHPSGGSLAHNRRPRIAGFTDQPARARTGPASAASAATVAGAVSRRRTRNASPGNAAIAGGPAQAIRA